MASSLFKYSDETCSILDEILCPLVNVSDKDIGVSQSLIDRLCDIVDVEELSGFYYIIFEHINRLRSLRAVGSDLDILIRPASMRTYLNVNVGRLIHSDDVGLDTIAADSNYNISIHKDELEAKRFLYSYCTNRLEEISKLEVTIPDAIIKMDSLYQSVCMDYSHYTIHTSAEIINGSVRVGKETLSGPEGYFEFLNVCQSKFLGRRGRYLDNEDEVLALDSVESFNEAARKANTKIFKLGKFNIPPFDDKASMMSRDIIVIIGDEGTGKTNYMVNIAIERIVNGFSVIIMSGESDNEKIMFMLLSRFIYIMSGYKIHWLELQGDRSKFPEEVRAVINDCSYKLFESKEYGKAIIVYQFSYYNLFAEINNIVKVYRHLKFGQIFIDHTGKLKLGTYNENIGYLKNANDKVQALFDHVLNIKRKLGISCFILSHTGAEAAKDIAKGKDPGKRIGALSSATTKDADVVLHLESGPALEAKRLVKAIFKKYREVAIDSFRPVILRKDFSCCNYIYSEELQAELGLSSEKEVSLSDVGLEELID